MRLHGSCHCQKVRFTVECPTPWPYQRCYCQICRKTAGAGGYCINLGGRSESLVVAGAEHVRVYRAALAGSAAERTPDGAARAEASGALEAAPAPAEAAPALSDHERHFCGHCGSHLWASNSRWPELVHPVAGAIDTPLPAAPALVHMMMGSKAAWVPVHQGPRDEVYEEYPERSLEQWHRDGGYGEPGERGGA